MLKKSNIFLYALSIIFSVPPRHSLSRTNEPSNDSSFGPDKMYTDFDLSMQTKQYPKAIMTWIPLEYRRGNFKNIQNHVLIKDWNK